MKKVIVIVVLAWALAGTDADARYFSPQTGNFLSPDRAGMIDGPNEYAYAKSNPAMYTDPTGMTIYADFMARFILLEAAFTVVGNYVISALDSSSANVYVSIGPVEQRGTSYSFGITTPAYRPRPSSAGALSCPVPTQSEIDVTIAPRSFFDVNGRAMGLRQADILIHEFVHADEYSKGLPHSEFDARGVEFLFRRERGVSSVEESFWLIANSPFFPRSTGATADLTSAGARVLGRLNSNRSVDPRNFSVFGY